MKKDFDPENSHDQNVKIAIDKIIGQETSFRRLKKTQEDQKRILFCRIIDNIVMAEERAISLDEGYQIDMSKYNEMFFDIITSFLSFSFNKQQINLINFYLYDRYCVDGAVLDLIDDEGNVVLLENANDLWYLINKNK
jgi:hypothetical protein